MKYILISLMFVLSLTGCSVLDTVSQNENKLAVQYATLKVTDGEPARVERLKEWVTEAREYIKDGTEVSVAYLAEEARLRIKDSNLDPADTIVAMAVLAEAERRIRDRLGEGLLQDEERVKLLTVIGWIEEVL